MRKTIHLSDSLKIRFDKMKGKKSHETFIEEMIGYFEVNGFSPSSNVVAPSVAIKEQANRIIEVVRGIEKSQKMEFKLLEERINNAHFSQLTEDTAQSEAEKVLQDLISENERIKKENEQLKLKETQSEAPVLSNQNLLATKKEELIRVRNLVREFSNSSRFRSAGLKQDKYEYDKVFILESTGEMETKLTALINSL